MNKKEIKFLFRILLQIIHNQNRIMDKMNIDHYRTWRTMHNSSEFEDEVSEFLDNYERGIQ